MRLGLRLGFALESQTRSNSELLVYGTIPQGATMRLGLRLGACTSARAAFERHGYKLKDFEHMYLKPGPDSGLGPLKCSEFTRERPP